MDEKEIYTKHERMDMLFIMLERTNVVDSGNGNQKKKNRIKYHVNVGWVPWREYKYITIFFDNLNWNWFRYGACITLTLAKSNILHNTCGFAMKRNGYVRWCNTTRFFHFFFFFAPVAMLPRSPMRCQKNDIFNFFMYISNVRRSLICVFHSISHLSGKPLRILCINNAWETYLKFWSRDALMLRIWCGRRGDEDPARSPYGSGSPVFVSISISTVSKEMVLGAVRQNQVFWILKSCDLVSFRASINHFESSLSPPCIQNELRFQLWFMINWFIFRKRENASSFHPRRRFTYMYSKYMNCLNKNKPTINMATYKSHQNSRSIELREIVSPC